MLKRVERVSSKLSPPAVMFEKALRAFETGDLPYFDFIEHLQELLSTGASPSALLEVLRRRELIEPLPEHARQEVEQVLEQAADARGQRTDEAPPAEASQAEAAAAADEARFMEEQLARQSADYKVLTRAYERARDAGSAASARTTALTAELAAAQARSEQALRESEQHQSDLQVVRESLAALQGEFSRMTAEFGARARSPANGPSASEAHAQRVRIEALLAQVAQREAALAERDVTRAENEAVLADRDAALAQRDAALADRDAQLLTLQRDYGRLVAALESRTHAAVGLESDLQAEQARSADSQHEVLRLRDALARHEAQLEALQRQHDSKAPARDPLEELQAAQALESSEARARDSEAQLLDVRARLDAAARQLSAARDAAAANDAQRRLSESLLHTARAELQAAQTRSNSYLEKLRSREWRRGHEELLSPRLRASAPWIGAGVAVLVLIVLLAALQRRHGPLPAVATALPAAVQRSALQPGSSLRDCPACPVLTVLPAGRFKQGSAADKDSSSFEKPVHWVAIGQPFALSTNDVTVDEFRDFVAATGRDVRGCDVYDGDWRHDAKISWDSPGFPQTGSHPVTCVSWNDAKAYADWLSMKTGQFYRLPSASEWEFAASAAGAGVAPWNADGVGACGAANVADSSAARRYPGWAVFSCDDGYVYTSPVGSFAANALGVKDMLGNVQQWTEDCWHADYTGAPLDGSARVDGPCGEHEVRGGSWFSSPTTVRANHRNHFGSDYRTTTVGVRVVRDLAS